ncbi:DNA polymerase III subunit beta [Cephaloticoccus primus]|uniref:Beta sliding clamp n=1 Tax=Cephaloticoccus primus TaxID=1548207 RepID=A0A139SHR8_9BACT|nr:DNA polymerase III subunit beta [Cephaloticoccus primus]KXU34118.1 DNA polymerase III subunit beta [Cephaloticoccus primus]
MKFKINRDHFANGLAQVLNVVGSRATMPILSNVLIEADNGQISLTTTNLDLGIRCQIKAEVQEAGAITLPVKRLAGIVRELPSVDVAVAASPNHQVKLVSGGSNFRIMGIPKDDFPPLPEFGEEKSFTLEQDELTTMLKSVSYAQSSDETRYILNGVYFNFADAKLTLVATDGRRLAHISKELEVPEASAGAIILPAKTASELLRLLDKKGNKVKINFNDRRAAFQIATNDEADNGLIDSIYLYSKVVEGSYPNYQQVIPKETHQRIKLERELFLQCVHRAALVCSEKANSIKIKLSPNLLEVTAQSPDFGESHESMAISYEGPELQVAFNPQFIMDPLRALTKDEVYFEVKDDISPGVFKTLESFICVIMPVRLN